MTETRKHCPVCGSDAVTGNLPAVVRVGDADHDFPVDAYAKQRCRNCGHTWHRGERVDPKVNG